jgi:predicted alpha/beta-hydrolase family hydrolase
MSEQPQWTIELPAGSTTAVHDAPAQPMSPRTVFVCAHGAGGNRSDRAMNATTTAFTARGLDVVRFNFLYREKGSSRPDAMPRLTETIAAVVDRVRRELAPERLIIGGRSMGGRASSMLAAEGFPCDGLLLLAYPLHPPGQPAKLRVDHLSAIRTPVLCINGTRDDLCRVELMEAAMKTVGPNWTLHWVEGADHSFHVLKSSGRTEGEVMQEVGDTAAAWLGRI